MWKMYRHERTDIGRTDGRTTGKMLSENLLEPAVPEETDFIFALKRKYQKVGWGMYVQYVCPDVVLNPEHISLYIGIDIFLTIPGVFISWAYWISTNKCQQDLWEHHIRDIHVPSRHHCVMC